MMESIVWKDPCQGQLSAALLEAAREEEQRLRRPLLENENVLHLALATLTLTVYLLSRVL